MAGIPDYSTTASSNATVGAVGFAEGMAPSAVNDSARALMADIAAEAQLETVAGTDTYSVTFDIVPSAYSTKMRMCLLFTNANTSATPTLNVNSLGAKTLVDAEGGALVAGSIANSSAHIGVYDGTNVRLLTVNASPTLGALAVASLTVNGVAVTGGTGSTVKITTGQTTNSSTLANATNLAFALTSGTYYTFRWVLRYESDTGTNGLKVGLTTPTFDTNNYSATVRIGGFSSDGTDADFEGTLTSSGDSVIATGVQGVNTAYTCVIEGTILPTSSANLQVQIAAEDNTNTITLLKGSCGQLWAL